MSDLNDLALFLFLLISCLSGAANCARLRGVTLESHPFIIKDGNQYKGYIIDVLNSMRNISDFDYYLYDTQELGTIDIRNGNVSGLLGEVRTNGADFGVSNIEVTEERRHYVDFTDPVLNYSISALILRSNIGNISTFQELADQTKITYGSLRNSITMKLFESSDDIVLQRMYALMRARGVPVEGLQEAVEKVKTTNYAFIADSLTIEGLAKYRCDLTLITDNRQYFQRHISIALPKGSKFLAIFNQFLKQLKSTGKLDEIYNKYWKSDCSLSSSTSLNQNSFINLIVFGFSVHMFKNKFFN